MKNPIRYNPFGEQPEVPDIKDRYDDMTSDDFTRMGCVHILCSVAVVGMLLAVMFVIAFFSGCKPQERIVWQDRHHYHTDTLRQVVHHRDSIYFSDSIYVSDFMRSDTVWRTELRWRTQYRDRWLCDTVCQVKTDTVHIVSTIGGITTSVPWWRQSGGKAAAAVIFMAGAGLGVWLTLRKTRK